MRFIIPFMLITFSADAPIKAVVAEFRSELQKNRTAAISFATRCAARRGSCTGTGRNRGFASCSRRHFQNRPFGDSAKGLPH